MRYPVMNLGQETPEAKKLIRMPPRMSPAERLKPPGCIKLAPTPAYPPRPPEISEYDAKSAEISSKYPMSGRPGYESQTEAFKGEIQTLKESPTGVAWQKYYADVRAAEEAERSRIAGVVEDYRSKGWTVTPRAMYEGGPPMAWDACPPMPPMQPAPQGGAPSQPLPPAPPAPSAFPTTTVLVGGGIAAAGGAALLLAGHPMNRRLWLGQVPLRSRNV